MILFVLMDAILLSLTLQKRTMYNFFFYFWHIFQTFLHHISKIWRRILRHWFVFNLWPLLPLWKALNTLANLFDAQEHAKGILYHWPTVDNLKVVAVLRMYIVIECEMVFQSANTNLGTRIGIFCFFSKIPCGIWKISFYMFFYACILSRNHTKSLLNFFSIQNLTLN